MTVTADVGVIEELGSAGCEEMLRRMWRIRIFEEVVARQAKRGEIRGAVHSSAGQEAAEVGACMAVRADDRMTGTHRSHGHPIAKGAELRGLMAELYGRSTGVCKGYGGSMHLADFSVGSLGEAAVVAASVPVAVGAGLASSLLGDDRVCLAFFGDGAVNEGVWHEAANLAGVWRLPVIFLCENNGYGMSARNETVSAVPRSADRAAAYAMPGTTVDGQDVLAVYAAVRTAVARARRGEGPSLVEAMTYRYDEHALSMTERLAGTRPPGEKESWLARDPMRMFESVVVEHGVLTRDDVERVQAEARAAVEDAVEFARESPLPEPEGLWEDMYVDASAWASAETVR
jgi:TPP-dependent pyruvate/acetoin dehydrogenase alpha subunit